MRSMGCPSWLVTPAAQAGKQSVLRHPVGPSRQRHRRAGLHDQCRNLASSAATGSLRVRRLYSWPGLRLRGFPFARRRSCTGCSPPRGIARSGNAHLISKRVAAAWNGGISVSQLLMGLDHQLPKRCQKNFHLSFLSDREPHVIWQRRE
jgi:hypothetical protein